MPTHMVELDEVLRRHAWTILVKRSNIIRRLFLDEEDYNFTIDWSSLSLKHKLYRFSPKYAEGTLIETSCGNVVTGYQWVSLWSCDFENKASSKQSHIFRGTRDTTTWVDVDLDQYFTVNKEVSVEVNLPPNFSKFRAGRDNSLSLKKVKGQVFKEILSWKVNSSVDVQPNWRANAQLLAKEECSAIEFEIRTTLHNPKGAVTVSFLRKSDGSVAHIVNIANFEEAFTLVEEGGVLKPEEKVCVESMTETITNQSGDIVTQSYPQLITKGTCVCLSWSDQKVDIKTSPLSVDELRVDSNRNTVEQGGTKYQEEGNIVVQAC
ncbi:hypothetical protein Bpfe_005868 [Biomphalaria pfeifferi]|uniref:Uncharacterized protein n=1 Tax=Biomphalaria pfeifferi TaxID=112525 RepID=A0AAD8C3J8_BIOPF|nr:hypothetical protein Bpfe_005868 [Biomphalaria pfeifferi]